MKSGFFIVIQNDNKQDYLITESLQIIFDFVYNFKKITTFVIEIKTEMMITIEDYKRAYKMGENDKVSGEFTCFYTGCLNTAYELGRRGISVDFSKTVKATRWGEIPEIGCSWNYRDDKRELGVSVSKIDDEQEKARHIAEFCDRERITFDALLIDAKGSDNENLVLPLNVEQYDF